MSIPTPQGLLATKQPDLFFEDNAVGRMKKEIWEASDAQIDAWLAEYGFPAAGCEWAKPGSYIQTTVRHQVEANRRKNDIVLIPVGCTENHGQHMVSAADTLYVSMICEGVRRYTAKRGAPINLALPPFNYGGHPYHHLGMPGTVILREEVVRELLIDVMLGLWNDGFRKQIYRQQPRPPLDAGVGPAGVLQALPAPGHLPGDGLAPGGARVLPHQGEGRRVRHPLHPRRRVGDLALAATSSPRWWT